MPSFDVVSRADNQEIDNAISNSMKEVGQRYDFKGSISKIERKDNQITLHSEDDAKVKQVFEVFIGHIVKRSLDPKVIKFKRLSRFFYQKLKFSDEVLVKT